MFMLNFRPTLTRAPRGVPYRNAIAVFALTIGFAPLAGAQAAGDFPTEILFNPAEESWARVTRIVPPAYPKDALQSGTGAVVDINVVVGTDGLVKDVQRVEATPPDPRFENATRDVLKFWQFRNAMSARCQPIETVGNVRLTFNVVDGKEEITLSHRAAPQSTQTSAQTEARPRPKLVALNYTEIQRDARYPPTARRAGAQADVWVRAKIDPPTGSIIETETVHVVSYPAHNENAFKEISAFAIRDLKFAPMPEHKPAVTACVPMRYRLR